jgi:hypothetical protein
MKGSGRSVADVRSTYKKSHGGRVQHGGAPKRGREEGRVAGNVAQIQGRKNRRVGDIPPPAIQQPMEFDAPPPRIPQPFAPAQKRGRNESQRRAEAQGRIAAGPVEGRKNRRVEDIPPPRAPPPRIQQPRAPPRIQQPRAPQPPIPQPFAPAPPPRPPRPRAPPAPPPPRPRAPPAPPPRAPQPPPPPQEDDDDEDDPVAAGFDFAGLSASQVDALKSYGGLLSSLTPEQIKTILARASGNSPSNGNILKTSTGRLRSRPENRVAFVRDGNGKKIIL